MHCQQNIKIYFCVFSKLGVRHITHSR